MNAFLLCFHGFCFQASPIVVGTTVGAAALGARYLIRAWQTFKAAPRVRRFYHGGFEQVMTRREAALILGVRESAVLEKIKEAHRRVMVANHPDAGGSHYIASKINEAKDILLGKTKGANSAF
uniref:Mitochondrial import inner membrane translocase subunit TIM14-3-like isoform X1 n=1 Tax=Nicotiana sylvestris TaxID=4096 RepID=A0A1U7XYH0_NICSY|nr:PREDICTED: mitochondrial import inner membrane translocase subunit TIM14-3-like isoform X1 [Nicotiana sylvestris]